MICKECLFENHPADFKCPYCGLQVCAKRIDEDERCIYCARKLVKIDE